MFKEIDFDNYECIEEVVEASRTLIKLSNLIRETGIPHYLLKNGGTIFNTREGRMIQFPYPEEEL